MTETLRSPRWPLKADELGLTTIDLARYADSSVWGEPLIFLFELLADDLDWPEELPEIIFGEDFSGLAEAGYAKAALLTQLVLDPHTGWSEDLRRRGARALWQWNFRWQQTAELWEMSPVVAAADSAASPFHQVLLEVVLKERPQRLMLLGAAAEAIMSCAGELAAAEELMLWNTAIQDISPLAQLHQLQSLSLQGAKVQDLRPLENLHQLQSLSLAGNQIQDLRPLENLRQLQSLSLEQTKVQDLRPLQNLRQLQELFLMENQVQSLRPLHGLKKLKDIYLDDKVPNHQIRALKKARPKLESHVIRIVGNPAVT